MCVCVRVCAHVCVRGVKASALTRAVPRTGRPPRGHPGRRLQALVGNRRTGLSRSSAPSGSAAAADAAGGGAGVPSSVPSRGTCLPRRRSASCQKPVRLCVSVPVSRVAVLVGVCTVPATALQRVCRPPVAAAYDCFLGARRGVAPLGLQGSFPFACPSVVCSSLPPSDVCPRACMDFSSSVLCAECRSVFRDHPCSCRNG